MKTCSVCKHEKSLNDFYVKNKTLLRFHAQCKDCYKQKRKESMHMHYAKYGAAYRERARARRARIKQLRQEQLYTYLSDKRCELCGVEDMRVLDFDHIVGETKKFGIARAVNEGYAWELILEEIKKCRILCANCHRIRTAEQFGWKKMARWPSS